MNHYNNPYEVMRQATAARLIQEAMHNNNKGLVVKKDGKLKLFDNQSKIQALLLWLLCDCCSPPSVVFLVLLFVDRYVMEDYDARSTFSSFLPGVAGYFGKPVWAFYVNRGQAIATFGTESKDYPILEFNPANKAYQNTPALGFRTFIQGTRHGESFLLEPFSPRATRDLTAAAKKQDHKPKRILYGGTNEVEIEEYDGEHGIQTNVVYFILPEENFGALVRRTTITNTGHSTLSLSVLDGLAKMEPFGGPLDGMLKSMGRTLEGWMGVYHATDPMTGMPSAAMPFFKLSTEPSDQASVKIEQAGHYCFSFIESDSIQAKLLPIVYDTSKIFGGDTTLANAYGLQGKSVRDLVDNAQYGYAKTSSAFAAAADLQLKPGQNITIASVFGRAEHVDDLPRLASYVTVPAFVSRKHDRAKTMIDELTASVETNTVNPMFDGTVKEMFLDNSLRGGVPTALGLVDSDLTYDEDSRVKIFHAFSRIHGGTLMLLITWLVGGS
jgi:hypothetical protein